MSRSQVPPLICPDYWEQACAELAQRDSVMRELIAQYPEGCLQSRGDAFTTLARSVVGQQVSLKAAQTIWDRFVALLPKSAKQLTPKRVLKMKVDDMRQAGLSARKIQYLVDLALHFDEGKLQVEAWPEMADEAIIADLMAVRGIGRWTAEMFLMFHLLRSDILPLDDAGLIKGISQCYFSGSRVSRNEVRELAQMWHPWASVATWYLWRATTPAPIHY